jgi:hypothetical protein
MRTLVLDELSKEELKQIEEYLDRNLKPSQIKGLYWIFLPHELLTLKQLKYEATDGPFKLSVDLGQKNVKFELLVRGESLSNLGGGCVNGTQLEYVNAFIERMATELNLISCL